MEVENKKSVEKNCKVVKTESGEAEACEKKEDKRVKFSSVFSCISETKRAIEKLLPAEL